VHQPVQVPGGLLDLLAHLVVALDVEHVGDELERVLVVLDLRVEPRQVEAVRQVVLVDVAEVLVAAARQELRAAGGQPNPKRGGRAGENGVCLTQSRQ
jgi:hypothetical protein